MVITPRIMIGSEIVPSMHSKSYLMPCNNSLNQAAARLDFYLS